MKKSSWGMVLLGAPACGLVTSDAALAPFPGDGIGAFGDAAPVEVCLGTARIISPALATGATALCVPSGQTRHMCVKTADCANLEKCICGRCVVEPCQGGTACSDGQVCRGKRCTRGCALDADCGANERCISGGCARKCQNHDDCHYGERCDSLDDVCVVSLCGSGGTCGSGAECEAVAEIADLGEPTYLANEPTAFVELERNQTRVIHRVTIASPHVWRIEPTEPVFKIDGETLVGAPSVLRRGPDLELYAAVGNPSRIVRARSSDGGKQFVMDMDPVLLAEENWENGSVGSPSMVDFNGRTYLFYEGGAGAGIGLAEVTDSGAMRTQPNPILFAENVADPIFWRSITHVGTPQALVVDDTVRVLFTARGIEGFSSTTKDQNLPPESNDSIGLAVTTDMQSFALFPTGPVYTRLVNLRAYLGEAAPDMRLSADGAEMVFVSSDASGEAKTGLVRVMGRGGTN